MLMSWRIALSYSSPKYGKTVCVCVTREKRAMNVAGRENAGTAGRRSTGSVLGHVWFSDMKRVCALSTVPAT